MEAFGFAGPAVVACLSDAVAEVGDDLRQPYAGVGVNLLAGASDAGMFVLAWGVVGTPAGSEFEFAMLEVLLKFVPLRVGGAAVLVLRSLGAACVEEGAEGTNELLVEHGSVDLRCGNVLVPEQFCDDVDRQSAADRFGG